MLTSVEKAPKDVRAALAAGELVGTKGPREFMLGPEQHLLEWKRAAWGWADCRPTYPWRTDWTYEGEFAMEKGSVAEKGVRVVLAGGNGKTPPPKTVLLNGWQPTAVAAKGAVTYSFPPEAVVEGINQVVIPASEPAANPKDQFAFGGVSVKVDL